MVLLPLNECNYFTSKILTVQPKLITVVTKLP
uniref:Uncharacterized protein n=1 Tax=Anguilla anguilla TaxID=7936 RepID=A0A0E9Q5Z7_ANGAN